MCLVGPGHVRRSDECDCQPSMLGRLDEFMRCPVFHYEAQRKHQGPKRIVDHLWRNIVHSYSRPDPVEHYHRNAVYRP